MADAIASYDKIFQVWSQFVRHCKDLLYSHITDLEIATVVAVSRIQKTASFSEGEKIFLALENLFVQNKEHFDKRKVSGELLKYHDNFSYYAACGYYEQSQYEDAIQMANVYIEKVTEDVKVKLKAVLTDAYEENGQLEEAYETARSMFCEHGKYDLYKRARFLADY